MSNNLDQATPQGANGQKVMAMPLSEMIVKVSAEPKLKFIYSGIKENSIGIVVGPSKSGKTMYCENLGMAIAAGLTSYLDIPIDITNRKVLIISFEEHYTNRTERNIKQVEKLTAIHGSEWLSNYIVAGEDMPTYIHRPEHWQMLVDTISKYNPGVVILDSVTRMCEGIEDSAIAQEFTRNLRELSKRTNTTILAIHHTHKMFGRPLTIDNIAGSRVIAQELDFMIGINRTGDGRRYMKDVAFRYAPNEKETVTTFAIDDNCWLNSTGEADEMRLLAALDGRRDDVNAEKIHAFLIEQGEGDNSIPFSVIETALVDTGVMSKQTAHTALTKLVKDGKIEKVARGHYKAVS